MGSSSSGPGGGGGLLGNGSANSGGTGHGGTGHASGHVSSSTGVHGAAVAHNNTVAAAKNSTNRNQVIRNGFTSDTMLARSPDRIRNRRISSGETSNGSSAEDTQYKKKLKTNHSVATRTAAQNDLSH